MDYFLCKEREGDMICEPINAIILLNKKEYRAKERNTTWKTTLMVPRQLEDVFNSILKLFIGLTPFVECVALVKTVMVIPTSQFFQRKWERFTRVFVF